MTALVTGATGFIGRVLVDRLVACYGADAVICLVKPEHNRERTEAVESIRRLGVRIIEGDLNDRLVSREPAPPVAVVFHLAANIDTGAPHRAHRVNDRGTGHLLNWLAPVLPGIRVMYTSSVAALDRSGPAKNPLDESSPCSPRTAYGLTKLRGERILQKRAPNHGFTYTILRLGTVYGPGAKRGGLFDQLITLSVTNSPLARLNWPGRVSVMHVDDVVDLLVTLASHSACANEIYCVANPEAPTVGELAQRIGRACGRQPKTVALPSWVWRLARRVTWLPVTQAAASLFAAQAYWRFTLLVDNAFWLDTRKLQKIWTAAPLELDAGLTDMIGTFFEIVTKL
jgi:UDP-N-acetyl-alpha-D-quinovosamine dehydrogenase